MSVIVREPNGQNRLLVKVASSDALSPLWLLSKKK